MMRSAIRSGLYRKVLRGFLALGMTIGIWSGAAESAAAIDAGTDEALKAVYDRLAGGERIHGGVSRTDYETPDGPTVYLTFDDGPSRLTPRVLDILKDEGIKATFFELGQQAEKYPDTVKRVVEEGHTLGTHTYNHVYKELYQDFGQFWSQVEQSEEIFRQIVGFRPTLLRAPGGTATNFDAFYFYQLEAAGYTIIDWNMDSSDASRVGISADEIVTAVRNSTFPEQAVLLMHDGTGHEASVEALRDVIGIFRDKGYQFATIGPNVKPVQFGLKPLKWKRATSFDAFAQNMQAAQEHAALLREEAADTSGETADGEQADGDRTDDGSGDAVTTENDTGTGDGEKPASPPEPGLSVSVGKRTWTMLPGEYDFHAGRFAVPLEGLSSLVGGRVVRAPDGSQVTLRIGLYGAVYDFKTLTLREYWPGRSRVTHLPDMKRVGRDMLVPLREAVSAAGSGIAGYTLSESEREVSLMPELRVWLPLPPSLEAANLASL